MTFLSAILPVIVLVCLGQLLRRFGVVDEAGWKAIDTVCYRVLFPALIVVTLARAPFENVPLGMMVILIATQLIMGALVLAALPLLRRFSKYDGPAIGSIIQSNVRWNTFIALSLAGSIFGEEGIALIALAAAAMIPTANILSVYGFLHFAGPAAAAQRRPLRELLRNPLVLACILGGLLNVTGLAPAGPMGAALDLLAAGSIGLGLLAAGAGINLAALRRSGARTLLWSVIRLVVAPAIALAAGWSVGIEGTVLTCMVLAAAVPTAVNGYILARRLNGDTYLSANLIAVQTVLSMLTLPLFYYLTLP